MLELPRGLGSKLGSHPLKGIGGTKPQERIIKSGAPALLKESGAQKS
jgi:hypothetical protein